MFNGQSSRYKTNRVQIESLNEMYSISVYASMLGINCQLFTWITLQYYSGKVN